MVLKNQYCGLELAKRLKELVVRQESLFVWIWDAVKKSFVLELDKDVNNKSSGGLLYGARIYYSAFTVAELGEMLPQKVHFSFMENNTNSFLFCQKYSFNHFMVMYGFELAGYSHGQGGLIVQCSESATTEADARAKMLIYLLENKLIDTPK